MRFRSNCPRAHPGQAGTPAPSAGCEDLHHGARVRFDLRSRFANFHPGDSLDLLLQFVGGVGEQLPVKLLQLAAPAGLWARAFSAGDKAPCSVISSVSPLRTTATELGSWPVRCCWKAIAACAICFATLEASFSIALPPK